MADEVQTNDDLSEHRVAVVVFTTVCAVDNLDAMPIAEDAVRLALSDAERFQYGRTEVLGQILMRRQRGTEVPLRITVQVAAIRELGFAFGDSYLQAEPTLKAYRGGR